jgi:hypothetical protein
MRPGNVRPHVKLSKADIACMRLKPSDVRIVERRMNEPRPCLLCGEKQAVYIGLFSPDRPEVWGAPPGTVGGVIGYRLCARCKRVPEVTQHVEARLMRDIAGSNN